MGAASDKVRCIIWRADALSRRSGLERSGGSTLARRKWTNGVRSAARWGGFKPI